MSPTVPLPCRLSFLIRTQRGNSSKEETEAILKRQETNCCAKKNLTSIEIKKQKQKEDLCGNRLTDLRLKRTQVNGGLVFRSENIETKERKSPGFIGGI